MLALGVLALSARESIGEPVNALAAAVAAALKSGNAAGADNLATQALAIGNLSAEERARVLLNRGLARDQLGHHDDALVDFTAALGEESLQPSDRARALFDRGVALDELGRTANAIGDYSAALKIDAAFAAALNNRANAYRRMGRFDEARRDYTASLAANNPRPEYPQFGLGQIAEAQGDPAAARDCYSKALAANPNYTLASQRLAVLGDFAAPALKPPKGVADAPVVLRLPPLVVGDAKAKHPAPVALHRSKPASGPAPGISPAAYAPPGDALDLRPTIVETLAPARTASGPHPRPAKGDTAQIQLGAWRDEAEAAEGWNHLVRGSGGLLDGLTPQIVMADIPGKGRYWRLRVAPVGQSTAALCSRLQAQGIACMPVN